MRLTDLSLQSFPLSCLYKLVIISIVTSERNWSQIESWALAFLIHEIPGNREKGSRQGAKTARNLEFSGVRSGIGPSQSQCVKEMACRLVNRD